MLSKTFRFPGAGFALVALLLAGASRLGATPPTPPWRQLEQRATREGAAVVRAEYRRQTDEILARLAVTREEPTLVTTFRRVLDTAWLHEFLRSWARVEARDVRGGKEAAVLPLVACLEAGHTHFAQDAEELERLRAAASPEELARLGLTVSPVASLENDRRQALRQVALLAKVGKHTAALERVFALETGGIDGCATPAEFQAFPHKWQDILGPMAPESGGVR